MIRIHEIIDKISSYMPPEGIELIQKAYVFSASAHAGQVRRSGEPYLSHPLEVANILAEIRMDEATIAAGLLHDTVEDTKATIEEIEDEFGEKVADIVDGVTKISQMTFDTKEQAQAENIRKMVLAMAEDIRVLIVKLADRLHNMRTLAFMPPLKQKLIGQETMDIHAPLADRLGLHRIKVELEDLSLKYIKPDAFAMIHQGVHQHHIVSKEYIEEVVKILEDMLKKNNIKGRVTGRSKHIYSIYRKMMQQNLTLDQVYDVVAFRVILGGLRDCYAALGLAHAAWRPVPGRFKDFISMPKANMYQSLHTTVIGPEGQRIEIQIRTEDMNQLAEYGVAAHWLYKDSGKVKGKDISQFSWLRQIMDWQKEESDAREFVRSLRFDLFKDEVYVFTPRGDIKELPEGATPVDFAYFIHTQVGDRCVGAKVNGRLMPLSTELKNGDTVEIITDANRRPSRDWLKFVKTAKARTRINKYIQIEERAHSIALAKEMLEKEGRKMGVNVAKAMKDNLFEQIAKDFSYKSKDDLLSAIGYARLTPKKILGRLLHKDEPHEHVKEEVSPDVVRSKSAESVRLKGVDDVLVKIAKCCNPVPGDAIIGYISRGRGVMVHAPDCSNVGAFEPERLISVSWEGHDDKPYPARIRVVCKNIPGMLARISDLFGKHNVNIDSGQIRSLVDGTSEMLLTVEVKNAGALYRTLEKLKEVENVIEAVRTSGSVA